MKEMTLMVPFEGSNHYYEVVLLAGVTYRHYGGRILVGDVFVLAKGEEIPWLRWETFVHEEAEMYEQSEALWHQLCNVAKTESISQIYFWKKLESRQRKERERKEAAKSRPEPSRGARKILHPRFSYLRIAVSGMRTVVKVTQQSRLRFLTGGSPRRFQLEVRANPSFRILPPPAGLSVQLPPAPESTSRARKRVGS